MHGYQLSTVTSVMLVILLYHPDSHKNQIHFHEQKKARSNTVLRVIFK